MLGEGDRKWPFYIFTQGDRVPYSVSTPLWHLVFVVLFFLSLSTHEIVEKYVFVSPVHDSQHSALARSSHTHARAHKHTHARTHAHEHTFTLTG